LSWLLPKLVQGCSRNWLNRSWRRQTNRMYDWRWCSVFNISRHWLSLWRWHNLTLHRRRLSWMNFLACFRRRLAWITRLTNFRWWAGRMHHLPLLYRRRLTWMNTLLRRLLPLHLRRRRPRALWRYTRRWRPSQRQHSHRHPHQPTTYTTSPQVSILHRIRIQRRGRQSRQALRLEPHSLRCNHPWSNWMHLSLSHRRENDTLGCSCRILAWVDVDHVLRVLRVHENLTAGTPYGTTGWMDGHARCKLALQLG
jgi:hypothetical protein